MATPFTAVLGTVLYLALVIAGLGLISLLTGGTIVGDSAAGPLVGPAMILLSAIGVLLVLLRIARGDHRGRPFPIGLCLLVVVVAGAGYLLGGAIAWLLVGGGATEGLAAFLAHQFVQGYLVAVLLAALVCALVVAALVRTTRQLSG
jgi:hypothetical protein